MDDLRTNKLFEGLPDSDFQHLKSVIKRRVFTKDVVLIEDGQRGDTLFLLIAGSVKVTKTSADGKEVLLTTRYGGDFFGEMALLDDAPRSARIVTLEECAIGAIDKTDFNQMMLDEPQVALNILKVISARLRQSNEQIIEQFLERERMHKKELGRLAVLFEFCKSITVDVDYKFLFEKAREVIRKEIPCDETVLFMIDEGEREAVTFNLGDNFEMQRFKISSTIYERLLHEKNIFQTSDFEKLNTPAEPSWFWKDCKSMMSVPIWEKEAIRALIVIKNTEPQAWTDDEEAFVTALSSYITIALRNMDLVRQLALSEKLSVVGRSASSLLHDFKNLLSVIHNYAQLILKCKDLKDIPELLERITTSTRLMITMSQEVLSYVKGDVKLNRERVNIEKLLSSVTGLISEQAMRKSIKVEIHADPEIEYNLDADKMSRALYNLILNSCDAIQHDHGLIQLTASFKDEMLQFDVSDNGSGIPGKVLPSLFTPFMTTKQEGTGLGLAIVKGIVEAHSGSIQVSSKENVGTEFIIQLPLYFKKG